MKRLYLLFFTLSAIINALAQVKEIKVKGYVKDVFTGKGIKATVKYRSMPTGSISGQFQDSTFAFLVFGTAKYEVVVEAKGYAKKEIILDPKSFSPTKAVEMEFNLLPDGRAIRLNRLIFTQGESEISEVSFRELDGIVKVLQDNPEIVIQLEGHTDNTGNAKANLDLSRERVERVKKYILSKGISKDRVKTKAFGGTHPIANEMTPEARAMNRRVELRIIRN